MLYNLSQGVNIVAANTKGEELMEKWVRIIELKLIETSFYIYIYIYSSRILELIPRIG